jgi:tetratricopeptide (TPR) repeat protein
MHLIEVAKPELSLQNQKRWYKLIQAENDNIRAVIEWGSESEQVESAQRLVGALLWYWYYFGSPHEGRDLALKALAPSSAIEHQVVRARALNTAGYLQCMLGDSASARQSLEEAQSILRTSEDQASLAWSLQFLGLAYTFDREYDLADAALKEGTAIARRLGNADIHSFSFFQGDIDLQKGDHARAKTRYEESVNFQRGYGNRAFLAYPLRRLGYLALEQNDMPNAWNYFQESLTLNREVGDIPGVLACLTSMAALAIHQDKPVLAARLIGIVESRLKSLSINLLYLDKVELEQTRNQLQDRLDKATYSNAFSEGWEMNEERAMELVGEVLNEG